MKYTINKSFTTLENHIKHIFKEGGVTMYCTFNGKICLMMWDIVLEKWCYISEEVWYRLPEKARSRYTEERV